MAWGFCCASVRIPQRFTLGRQLLTDLDRDQAAGVACRQAVAWQSAGLRDLTIAVNLSAVQFRRPEIMEEVLDALAASGLAPGLLELN